jgi:nucleoside-diphosphate-sugar epimerase
MSTYFLTGATGYIGGSVAAALVKSGHRVRGLVRSADNASRIAERGMVPVLGELDDFNLLMAEARASDGVINTANSDHRPAVEALIAGLEGSNKPLIHTSGSSIVGDDARGTGISEKIFDEDTPLLVHPMKQARRDIDLLVLKSGEHGVRSAVICPSLIYGQGQGLNPKSVQIPFLVAEARKSGLVPMVGTGLNVWSNVHIDDVVDLYSLALSKAPAGAFYFAASGEASFLELGTALAKRLGLPGIEAVPAETAAERWGEPRAYFTFGSNSRVRANRARRELGWVPRHASVTDWIATGMSV